MIIIASFSWKITIITYNEIIVESFVSFWPWVDECGRVFYLVNFIYKIGIRFWMLCLLMELVKTLAYVKW